MKINQTNIAFFFVLLFCLFIFSGGFRALNVYVNHLAVTVREARQTLLAPFYAGFLGFGSVGLIYVANNARDKIKVTLGFTYVLCSYFAIEVLLWFVKK